MRAMPLDLTDAELATAAQACPRDGAPGGRAGEEARESYDARHDRGRVEALPDAGGEARGGAQGKLRVTARPVGKSLKYRLRATGQDIHRIQEVVDDVHREFQLLRAVRFHFMRGLVSENSQLVQDDSTLLG